MWLLLIPVCIAIFSSSLTSASEPHYVITVPAHLEEGTEGKACVTFLDLKGPVDIKLELKKEEQVHIVAEHKVTTADHSDCYSLQIPKIKDNPSIWLLHVSVQGENINVDDTKKVVITKGDDVCFIQTDKSTYKPGDIVKFRVLSTNLHFRPISKQHPLVELIDPNKNRIEQWLNVSTTQGFTDFSFHLAKELALGKYTINIPDGCDKLFEVAEYVLQRFQFNLNIPSEIDQIDKSFHLKACGSYTHGKPVAGKIDHLVCAEVFKYGSYWTSYFSNEQDACIDIKGEKTDSNGCVSRDIQLGYFKFSTTEQHRLKIESKLTEDETGHSEEASAEVYLNSAKKTVEFVECEKFYHKGFPYNGKIKVTDEKKQPMVNEPVTLYIKGDYYSNVTHTNLVTDSHGIAHFTIKTTEWPHEPMLKVHLSSDYQNGYEYNIGTCDLGIPEDSLLPLLFYSKSESLLSIQEHPKDVSCHSDQSVMVEYDIHKKNLRPDTDHLHFIYMLMSKSGIFTYKEHKVDIKDQANSPNLQGSFLLHIHVDEDLFPSFSLLVFSILPNGETIARSREYSVSPSALNKVKLSFSEEQVRPGENVNLKVTAAAGSLCSVRSVDKGYLLINPHDDTRLLTEVTNRLKDAIKKDKYTNLIKDEPQCPEGTSPGPDRNFDVYKLFLTHNLQIFTNTKITGEPVECEPFSRYTIKTTKDKDTDREIYRHITRSYFPDTWLYELVPMGSEGHTVLNRTTPHSITKWVTDALCLGSSGFAISSDVELTVFQPYFIDLIVPYSVVQDEKFTIQAVVFNYVKKCILIVVSLSNSEDLVTVQDKQQARCVCEGHSHSFSWDVSALKPKTLKIHVDSGSIEVEGECSQDTLQIGKAHRKDSVEKNIVVKPRGEEKETAKTFLISLSDNQEEITINIDAPKRLVAGSERAHIIIQGDLMANMIVNLDNILDLPDGCGEQNVARFARHVYTLDYLNSIHELTCEIKVIPIESLKKGYQRQLTFRNKGGYFATFPGGPENLWLTAFTVKAFSGAQKFIYIDEKHIQQAVKWMFTKQRPDGCFNEEGHYFNNELEADNLVTRTAYVTIALLEHDIIYDGRIVENALKCLRKSVEIDTSVYTQALLAYAFTLSGDRELRDKMLKKLDESAVHKEGSRHWETDSCMEGQVETASYVVLAILSDRIRTKKSLEDSGDIVRWIVKRQNPQGGFYSSQDTTIALQALAKYAKASYQQEADSTVTIRSNSGFEKTVRVDKNNYLLVQTVDLPEIPGEYTVTATGDGFVYLQSHLYYHALPEEPEIGYFSFNVSVEPSTCTHASWKKFNIHMDAKYSGKRQHTNMAIIVVDTVSGYVPDKDSVKKLKKNPLVERTEVTEQSIYIYLTKLTHDPVSFVLTLQQEALVQNLQPGIAEVYDYYNPAERSVVEYSAPCSSRFEKTENH
ncbi:alpha-2-macroglobulin-like isoform X2 [Dendropsophus ebraccatus]|uniref:alpha-2-macroglobulin-like isoform X2 n=1 Tax=Dendropsophus ebraccatus TaxID=150705 RepID=UPI0038314ACC